MKPSSRSHIVAMLLAPAIGYGVYLLLPPFVFLPPEGLHEITSLVLAPLAVGLAVGFIYPEIWLRLCVLAISIPVLVDALRLIIVVPIDLFFLGTWIFLVFVGGACAKAIRKHARNVQRA